MVSRPLLTIITVTYKDIDGLRRTLQSLGSIVQHAGAELEVIVVDGGSGPDIHRVGDEFPWASIRSECDAGIYDAMNKGLRRSRGEYIWFLNGGDESSLVSWGEIARPLACSPGSIVFAAYELRIGSRSIQRLPRQASYIWHGLPTSHQAIFYPGDEAREMKYSDRFSMVGDYHFTAQMLSAGIPSVRIEVPVSRFYMDGISFEQSHRVALEASIVQREVLKLPLALRGLSRVKHRMSRDVRRWQSKMWQ